jgi:hypothetical protein
MALSSREAISAGRAWADERWVALAQLDRPRTWPGTLREARQLPVVERSCPREGDALACALVIYNAAEARWRELVHELEAAVAPAQVGDDRPA